MGGIIQISQPVTDLSRMLTSWMHKSCSRLRQFSDQSINSAMTTVKQLKQSTISQSPITLCFICITSMYWIAWLWPCSLVPTSACTSRKGKSITQASPPREATHRRHNASTCQPTHSPCFANGLWTIFSNNAQLQIGSKQRFWLIWLDLSSLVCWHNFNLISITQIVSLANRPIVCFSIF